MMKLFFRNFKDKVGALEKVLKRGLWRGRQVLKLWAKKVRIELINKFVGLAFVKG